MVYYLSKFTARPGRTMPTADRVLSNMRLAAYSLLSQMHATFQLLAADCILDTTANLGDTIRGLRLRGKLCKQ